MQVLHGYYCNRNATNSHYYILDNIAEYNTMHTAEHGIKNRKQCEDDTIKMRNIMWCHSKGHIILHRIPGNKYFYEFSQPNKTVGQKTEATDQCKCYHNGM